MRGSGVERVHHRPRFQGVAGYLPILKGPPAALSPWSDYPPGERRELTVGDGEVFFDPPLDKDLRDTAFPRRTISVRRRRDILTPRW